MKTGSCLCGGVRFELRGELDAIIACHCTQCRKIDGTATTSVCAGAIDGPTDLKLVGHIFVADAGDYYSISGGNYRKDQS